MKPMIKNAGLLLMCSMMSFTGFSQTETEYRQTFMQRQLAKGYTQKQIDTFLKPAKKNEVVLKAIRKPWEAQPWFKYYPIFITQKRIDAGVAFWKKHRKDIERAEKKFKVDAKIIVSIIGVETFYGKHMGSYNTRDALYSLGLFYPPRSKLFLNELGSFMDLVMQENLDPQKTKGSYAGAMGYGQFISSSYLHYAVDFNQDGKRDLYQPVDAIGSVANYFKQHKWKLHAPVVVQAKVPESLDVSSRLWHKEAPQQNLKDWKTYGVTPIKDHHLALDQKEKVLLFKLEHASSSDYWLGLHNFYVITRYNHSQLYAMAVHQLSERIESAYQKVR